MAEDPSRKKSLSLRLFRKGPDSRKSSLDSTKSRPNSISEPHDPVSGIVTRRGFLRKPRASKEVNSTALLANEAQNPTSTTANGIDRPTSGKLRKKSTKNYPTVSLADTYKRNEQTGEQQIDHTDLLHSLVHQDSSEGILQYQILVNDGVPAEAGEKLLSKLPPKVWQRVYHSLGVVDLASLSLACKAFDNQLKSVYAKLQSNTDRHRRLNFLLRLDDSLPDHLFCFACEVYHRRLDPGSELLKPTNTSNPVFTCPAYSNVEKRISRARITSNRTLPYTFVQLVMRHYKFGPSFGISTDVISRRYKEINNNGAGDWSHQTRYCIVNGRLLMRVTSQVFATASLPPAGLRNLLYNPSEEFSPFFSTCPHWRDGVLMPTVKCALSHIPAPVTGSGIDRVGKNIQARLAHTSPLVTLCGDCRPMRRCPQCPTEYLIEIKMTEDRQETDPRKTFKQALVVTRWSDLGDGSVPHPVVNDKDGDESTTWSREWVACAASPSPPGFEFDSFAALGKRAISGVFESHFNVDLIPGQRILNLNPKGDRKGENGHDWY